MKNLLKSTILTISAFSLTGCGLIDKIKGIFDGKDEVEKTEVSKEEFKRIGTNLMDTVEERLESLKEIKEECTTVLGGEEVEHYIIVAAGNGLDNFEITKLEGYEADESMALLEISLAVSLGSLPLAAGAVEGVTPDFPEDVKYFTYSDGTYGVEAGNEKERWDKYGLPIETLMEGFDEETQQYGKSTATFTYKA